MTIRTITPSELHKLWQAGQAVELIDVRTPGEYAEVHIDGARLVPLDGLNPQEFLSGRASAAPLYVICRSGSRADKACQKLRAAGFHQVVNVQGGTLAWQQAGLPVVRGQIKVIPLERKVRIGAGVLVLLGVILGGLIHPAFCSVAGFVGAGLVFAGVTDWCGMAMVLSRMPWNQRSDKACSG